MKRKELLRVTCWVSVVCLSIACGFLQPLSTPVLTSSPRHTLPATDLVPTATAIPSEVIPSDTVAPTVVPTLLPLSTTMPTEISPGSGWSSMTWSELRYINILEWDNDGRLWVATDGVGLSMFDGEQWYNWQPETSDIREDAIRGMAVANGKVYAGTFGSAASGGVNILDIETGRWTNFWPEESPLSGGGVGGIAVDSFGRVYFPTAVGILDVYDGENWEHIPMPLPDGYLLWTTEGLIDDDGNYWLATGGFGLWKYDGTDWVVYGIPGNLEALAVDQAGRLWVGGEIGLVVRDLDETWNLYTSEELPFENWIQDIAVDAEGRVWVITFQSLFVFNGQQCQAFSTDVVGTKYWGDALAFDQEGGLWMEAGDGLAVFRGSPNNGPFVELSLRPAQKVPESDIIVSLD